MTCASALDYDAAQLQAWWNASYTLRYAGLSLDDCPPEDACRRPAAPARVALLLRGESFRNSAAQHTRETCTEKSLAAQACYGSGSDGASATGVRLLALVAAVVAAL